MRIVSISVASTWTWRVGPARVTVTRPSSAENPVSTTIGLVTSWWRRTGHSFSHAAASASSANVPSTSAKGCGAMPSVAVSTGGSGKP